MLIISRLRFHRKSYHFEFLGGLRYGYIFYISPPHLSLIGPLTTEIYYRTEKKTRYTDRQTHRETENDSLPLHDVVTRRSLLLNLIELAVISFFR